MTSTPAFVLNLPDPGGDTTACGGAPMTPQ